MTGIQFKGHLFLYKYRWNVLLCRVTVFTVTDKQHNIILPVFFRPSPQPRGSARRKTASSLILRGHF